MAIRVNCSDCQTMNSVRDESAGKSVRCRVCQGLIRVPGAVMDVDEEFGRPEKAPRRPKKKAVQRSGTPIGVVLAMASVGILILLNLWELASDDDLVWKLIAVIRLCVEARVLWGLKEQQNQTALSATIAAVMMLLLSLGISYLTFTNAELQSELTTQELTATKVYLISQTLAELGVIIGINLPASRAFLSK